MPSIMYIQQIFYILGYLTSFIEMGNLAGLRTFRVLRALKTVAILPSKLCFVVTVIIYPLHRVYIYNAFKITKHGH